MQGIRIQTLIIINKLSTQNTSNTCLFINIINLHTMYINQFIKVLRGTSLSFFNSGEL